MDSWKYEASQADLWIQLDPVLYSNVTWVSLKMLPTKYIAVQKNTKLNINTQYTFGKNALNNKNIFLILLRYS